MRVFVLICGCIVYSFFGYSQKKCIAIYDNEFASHNPITPLLGPSDAVTLPVVVHILWELDEHNISEAQILSQINVLNEDFSLMNAHVDEIPEVFKSVAVDTEISFCLALRNPEGLATNGITRRKTQVKEIGLTDNYYRFDQGGQDAWDPSRYINIWVADFGDSEIEGYATFPGQAMPAQKEGILMNYKAFGNQGTAEFPHDEGHACTHEMGHYLNLQHIWGSGSSCDDDDEIADTPLQDFASDGCPIFPDSDACTQGDGIMFMNFMDYTDDACVSMFTRDQSDRMMASLILYRQSLIDSDACITSNTDIKYDRFTIIPNPGTDLIKINGATSQELTIFNISGQVVLIQLNTEWVDISELSQGVYLIKSGQQIMKFVKI